MLTVADDRGRIVAETASNAAPFALLMSNVRVGHDETLFLLLGDWLGWCAIALLAIVVARAVWPPSRGAGAHSTVAPRRMQPWGNIRTVQRR